jgi:tetratricopeptide (TPR) repeat protein
MKPSYTPKSILAVICILILTAPTSAPSQDSFGNPSTFETEEADETYFLLRTLEWLYEQLPLIMGSEEEFTNGVAELKGSATQYKILAELASVEPEVADLFEDFQRILKVFYQSIQSLIEADKKPFGDTLDSVIPSSLKGYAHGKTSMVALTSMGVPPEYASFGAAGIGILSAGASIFSSGKDAYAKRELESENVINEFRDHHQHALTKARLTARSIATRRGWNLIEIGWDPDLPSALVQALVDDDMLTLEREVGRIARQRPRDPYVQSAWLDLKIHSAPADYRSTFELVKDHLRIIDLVPKNAAYDDSRLLPLISACLLALQAADLARRESNETTFGSEAAKLALLLCDRVLVIKETSPNGVIHVLRALALLGSGRTSDAMETLELTKGNVENASAELQSTFLYAEAVALSQKGRYEEALKMLEVAMSLGLQDLNLAFNDPFFATLREWRKDEFLRIFEVNWKWTISDDWLFDDVTLENTSTFPLTNVKLKLKLVNGSDKREVTLEVDKIGPGQRHLWTDAVTGTPGNWSGNTHAVLKCDQKPE